ncbi:hypothetical protein [Candidatus Magnetomonas plexicatena]|uniref:hypothetical protein n=1 Tax=Candidatus Magnetomonas plexicatena TaxID=2552947 RepID=UPI00110440A2|nr:hypothetical protein E2O03_006105 [Nitrospirales bacterium LBB_01]
MMAFLNHRRICKIALLCCVFLLIGGYAYSETITGKDFDSSKIPNIQKGVTTASQLLELFGEPVNNPARGDISSWQYSFKKIENCNGVNTVLSKKELWITIVDKIAVDYKYTEEPNKAGCQKNK